MRRVHDIKWMMAVVVIVFFSAVSVHAALAAEKTLIGKVNDNYQLVTDNQIYEIADTAEGNDLAENHISAKVRVTGSMEERDGMKIITVISYQVLSD
jgi:hypothetical protein